MIDTAKLREQLAVAMHRPPWCVYPSTDRMGAGIGARSTKYTIGSFEFGCDDELAVAAVNALPRLLAVYEAAEAWRDARGVITRALLPRDRRAEDRLIAAIDAARKQP